MYHDILPDGARLNRIALAQQMFKVLLSISMEIFIVTGIYFTCNLKFLKEFPC